MARRGRRAARLEPDQFGGWPRPGSLADVHADVHAVLAIGLVTNPAARWDSERALRDALARARRGEFDDAMRGRAEMQLAMHAWGAAK